MAPLSAPIICYISFTIHADSPLLIATEIATVRAAFGINESPIQAGSIKPEIGHLESASGLISLIKAILMLENDIMRPNLNFLVLKDSV